VTCLYLRFAFPMAPSASCAHLGRKLIGAHPAAAYPFLNVDQLCKLASGGAVPLSELESAFHPFQTFTAMLDAA
jgi:hypothetical protein